jgi:hypothetical protein
VGGLLDAAGEKNGYVGNPGTWGERVELSIRFEYGIYAVICRIEGVSIRLGTSLFIDKGNQNIVAINFPRLSQDTLREMCRGKVGSYI